MDYYVETDFYDHDGIVTSGGKGRDDYFEMLRRCGLKCIRIPTLKTESHVSARKRISLEKELARAWRHALKDPGANDTLVIHHPPSEKFTGFNRVIREVRARGCRIVVIVFDLEQYLTPYYRKAGALKKAVSLSAEKDLFRLADVIIVHNDRMKARVSEMGADADRIVSVGIMDYLRDEEPDTEDIENRTGRDLPVVFCGNLTPDKAGFLEDIPDDLRVTLYGPGYTSSGRANIDYRGSVDSTRMMDIISGSFGLVWDGASSATGAGVCGEYLRFNNPHKIALYLASGLPVIVWDESAMAEIVETMHCGITVSSLSEISSRTESITDEEYAEMRSNAIRIGSGMRKGEHIRAAVDKAVRMSHTGYDHLIVGSGLYGAAMARMLADAGRRVLVIDKRDHAGGNAYTEEQNGIMVHMYGPHIFHTDNDSIWEFANRFAYFNDYVHELHVKCGESEYTLPLNMNTFSELYGITDPDAAREIDLEHTDIYDRLIRSYSEKQWGRPYCELPQVVKSRIPVRYDWDERYFAEKYQGVPEDGYTAMISRMLDGIEVRTGTDYLDPDVRQELDEQADSVIFTGQIDEYYGYRYGSLGYRSLRFETEKMEGCRDFQGRAVVNYADADVPWTRITEHKWFAVRQPDERHDGDTMLTSECPAERHDGDTIITREYPAEWHDGGTIITREYPAEWHPGEDAFYPVRSRRDLELYEKYASLAAYEDNVMFGGRLGEYRYYDMDDVIGKAMSDSERLIRGERNALIIFTREPEAGRTKTRLMPYFSGEECRELHCAMLSDLADEMRKCIADIIIAYTGCEPVYLRKTFRRSAKAFIAQRGGSIGEKMENAISDVLDMGYNGAVLIGSDIPDLRHEIIEDAFRRLRAADAVMGPTSDGGYYLVGMKRVLHAAFDAKLYGVSTVYDETRICMADAGLSVLETDMYSDIDEPADAADFRSRMRDDPRLRHSHTGKFLSEHARISVIIPVYNEAAVIDDIIDDLRMQTGSGGDTDGMTEVIFVDGGSTDGTAARIRARISGMNRYRLLECGKGRALQMNCGAAAASGDILFFLHCDSRLPEDFGGEIRRSMSAGRWGCFGLRFESKNVLMLTNRIISNHRAFRRGIPFGDQGIFIDRELFFEAGMFREMPVMEDYEFSLRLRKAAGKPRRTGKRILTSARRYGKGTAAIARTELEMWNLRRLYRRGISAEELAGRYRDIR